MQSILATRKTESLQVRMADFDEMSESDKFVMGHRGASVYHLSGWRNIVTDVFGRETYYFVAQAGGEIVGVLPLVRLNSILFGDFLVSLPYLNYGGMLTNSSDVRKLLVSRCEKLCAELRVRHVELRHTSDILELPVRTDKICMNLDLPDDPELLWKKLGAKLRAQIKRPLREGAEVTTGGAELIDRFYPIFSRKYRDLGIPVYPKTWFESIISEFRDRAHVNLVTIAGNPAAASIVIEFNGTSEVAWAASAREADRVGANMFLYWSMLENASASGQRVFDFGRTTVGSGTHRFKKQWGARPVQLYWHYILGTAKEIPHLNLDNPKYRMAAEIWRKLPLSIVNRVGPLLVRNLP